MEPKFEPTRTGLVIRDPIERQEYRIKTKTSVTPKPVCNERIPFPMDSSVEITTDCLSIPINNIIYVRYPDGKFHAEIRPGEEVTLPRGEYILDLSGSMKVYAFVNGEVQIRIEKSYSNIVLTESTTITISARSYHRRPANTITTTANPRDLMKAVSMFGSALKTTATERSYSTHRGHPPELEVGDSLNIPSGVSRPQTGVRIEIPPTLRHTFVVTPLAYYLGAEIVSGPIPRLVTETGYSYPLVNDESDFETVTERTLKQIFLLDCIVQTEGETPSPLRERRELEPVLTFDIRNTYDKPIAEQLETYLEVPFTKIEPELPDWHIETYLEPTADHIEFLPFITTDLTTVRVSDVNCSLPVTQDRMFGTSDRHTISENSKRNKAESMADSEIQTIKQVWKSSDGSEIMSMGPLSAFRNTVTQPPRDGPFEVEVICNDPAMVDEAVSVNSIYGNLTNMSYDVTVRHKLTKSELRTTLTNKSDFIHYIGHIDSDGFRCENGTMDASTIESVGARSFFLNACESYEQGMALIESGSLGGIVTRNEIENNAGITAGSTIAQLLSYGLPLYGVLFFLQNSIESAKEYRILGDSTLTLSQSERIIPTTCNILQKSEERSAVLTTWVTPNVRQGGISMPYISSVDSYHVIPKCVFIESVSRLELIEFLNTEKFPVLFEGEFRWSDEIRTTEL